MENIAPKYILIWKIFRRPTSFATCFLTMLPWKKMGDSLQMSISSVKVVLRKKITLMK